MHQRPFLITSAGRTGTKWLAAQLQVPHEPSKWSGRAVSPKHLWMWVMQGWRPPMQTEFGVIVREPCSQLVSVKRRAIALKAPGKVKEFMGLWRSYLKAMQLMIDWGALVISYEAMTTDRDYLRIVADLFECQVAEERFEERLNRFGVDVPRLSRNQQSTCDLVRETYETWLTKHGI